jgi:hypothetical protein
LRCADAVRLKCDINHDASSSRDSFPKCNGRFEATCQRLP